MKKRSRKSFTVSPIFAVRVIRDHVGRVQLQIIKWAHSGKDSKLKKFIRLLDGAPAPYLDEKEYQWCANDAETPTPLAGVNTAISDVVNCDVLRLRANIANTGTADAKEVYIGLRYSDDGGVTWYSLGGAPDAPANPHFEYRLSDFGIDKTAVTTLILTASDTTGVHIESVPTAELTIAVGTTVEYDFCIHCTDYVSSYTTYLFKIVKTDETGAYVADLDAYTTQPELDTGEIIVVAPSRNQKIYRWYENVDAQTPVTPKAPENTAITGVEVGEILRIRLGCSNDGTDVWTGEQFILQYSPDKTAWYDVASVGSTTGKFRFYDNPTPVDGSVLTTLLLTGSNVAEHYCESNPTPIMADIAVNNQGEWDFAIQANPDDPPASGQTYYFRLIRSTGEEFETYTNYPQLIMAVVYEWYDRGALKLWEPDKYSNILAVYFEATLRTTDPTLEAGARLFNVDDDVAIEGSLVETLSTEYIRVRSGDIKANMPTVPKQLRVQVGRK